MPSESRQKGRTPCAAASAFNRLALLERFRVPLPPLLPPPACAAHDLFESAMQRHDDSLSRLHLAPIGLPRPRAHPPRRLGALVIGPAALRLRLLRRHLREVDHSEARAAFEPVDVLRVDALQLAALVELGEQGVEFRRCVDGALFALLARQEGARAGAAHGAPQLRHEAEVIGTRVGLQECRVGEELLGRLDRQARCIVRRGGGGSGRCGGRGGGRGARRTEILQARA